MKMSTKDTHIFMSVNGVVGIAKHCVVLRGDVLVLVTPTQGTRHFCC